MCLVTSTSISNGPGGSTRFRFKLRKSIYLFYLSSDTGYALAGNMRLRLRIKKKKGERIQL